MTKTSLRCSPNTAAREGRLHPRRAARSRRDFGFIDTNYPALASAFVRRLSTIERRIGHWPKSAQEVEQRPGVRTVPFIRYPYRLFYRIGEDAVEILYIHHAARLDR